MPDMCSKPVGNGTVQFLCREESGHDGPCAAPEVGPSRVARAAWQAEQGASKPEIVQSSPPAVAPSPPINYDHAVVHDMVLGMLRNKDEEDLPPGLKSWMMGAVAMVQLGNLWSLWIEAEKAGQQQLVLTGAQVESLVPPSSRPGGAA